MRNYLERKLNKIIWNCGDVKPLKFGKNINNDKYNK